MCGAISRAPHSRTVRSRRCWSSVRSKSIINYSGLRSPSPPTPIRGSAALSASHAGARRRANGASYHARRETCTSAPRPTPRRTAALPPATATSSRSVLPNSAITSPVGRLPVGARPGAPVAPPRLTPRRRAGPTSSADRCSSPGCRSDRRARPRRRRDPAARAARATATGRRVPPKAPGRRAASPVSATRPRERSDPVLRMSADRGAGVPRVGQFHRRATTGCSATTQIEYPVVRSHDEPLADAAAIARRRVPTPGSTTTTKTVPGGK